MKNNSTIKVATRNSKKTILGAFLMLASGSTFAQATGIDAGTAELTTYIDPIGNLIIIIGAIVGLIGGVRVFIKWNNGDQDTNKAIMSWFGSCIFLVLVGIMVRAFFGL
tara:strand:- start:20214 stop:20540 length:327 start_codon:yes stop_codon:yes gene_type:complete